jgi:DNA polymerase I-like protein with 3'-5' exonuclease and polymerase domains
LWQRPALEREGRLAAYDLQRGCIQPVAAMEHRGFGLDHAQHRAQIARWEQERTAAAATFAEVSARPPPVTRREIAAWLQTALSPQAYQRWPRTAKSKELSTTDAHLKRLLPNPAAVSLLRLQALSKLISNFGPKLLTLMNRVTGRLHPRYGIAATKAGRFTCSAPNLQQFPSIRAPEFRRVIVPAPGHLLISADWNQVEMRAAGWLTRDATLTELYAQGRDLHVEVAALIARVPREQVTPDMRRRAKGVSFGVTYGMQAAGLVEYAFDQFNVVMTLLEAQRALNSIAQAFAQLHHWKQVHYLLCVRRGYIEIGCGRVVKAEWEPRKQLWFSLCCNLPIQGICADAMMRALQLTHRRLRAARLDAGLIATIHDELLVEANAHDAEAAAAILQGAMMDAFTMTFPGFPTVNLVEAKIGNSWAAVKD